MKKLFLIIIPFAFCFSQNVEIDSLQSLLRTAKGKERLAILFTLSDTTENTYSKESLEYAEEAIPLAKELQQFDTLAILYGLASYASTTLGNFAAGLRYGFESLDLSTKIGNQKQLASAHSVLGITYVYIGQYSKALEHHNEALKIREANGFTTDAIRTMNNIGIVYHNLGMYEKALEYYKAVVNYRIKQNDTLALIRSYHNIGFAELKLGHYAQALRNQTVALHLAEMKQYNFGRAYTQYNLGLIYTAEKKYTDAIKHFVQSKKFYSMLDQPLGIAQASNGLGAAYYSSGKYTQAIQALNIAVEQATLIRSDEQLKEAYELLYKIFDRQHNTKKAFDYFQLYSAAKDSLYNTVENSKIVELSTNLETMQQEREIENLKREKDADKLKLTQERYNSNLLIAGVCFLIILLVIFYFYSRKIHASKKLIEYTNTELETLNTELQEKIAEIKTLSGLLPICSHCKKIRNDGGYWEQLEGYISQHTSAKFSHGICPECMAALYPDYVKKKKS